MFSQYIVKIDIHITKIGHTQKVVTSFYHLECHAGHWPHCAGHHCRMQRWRGLAPQKTTFSSVYRIYLSTPLHFLETLINSKKLLETLRSLITTLGKSNPKETKGTFKDHI